MCLVLGSLTLIIKALLNTDMVSNYAELWFITVS